MATKDLDKEQVAYLRDQIAIIALNAIIPEHVNSLRYIHDPKKYQDEIAEEAYSFADAMLRAR